MTDGIDRAQPRRGLGTLFATRRRKLLASATVAVLVVGGGTGVALAATRGDDGRYRTATAEKADVTETLALTGQVSSADSAAAAFQVSGTVGTVLVKLGDEVAAGQKLATLDTTSLKNAVTSAQDTLAKDQQQLEDDLDAQSTGTTSSTSSAASAQTSSESALSGGVAAASAGEASSASRTPAPSTTPRTTVDSDPASSSTAAAAQRSPSAAPTTGTEPAAATESAAVTAAKKKVTSAQQALLDEYEVATAAQTASAAATTDAQKVCAPFLDAKVDADGTLTPADTDTSADTPTSDPTPTAPADDDPTTDPTADPTADPTTDAATTGDAADDSSDQLGNAQALLQDCQSSISDTLDKQKATAAAQSALQDAAQKLDDAVAALLKALDNDTQTTTGDVPSPSKTSAPTTGSTQKPSTGSSNAATGSGSSSAPGSSGTAPSSEPSGAGSSGTTGSSAGAGSSGGAGSSAGSGGGSGSPTSTNSKTITAEQILADRAQIDLAQSQVSVAEQNLGFATLSSPISGTVVSVALAAGDEVSAASTTAVITVQGEGGYIVTSTVALAKIAKVAAGQSASVALPAFAKTYTGTVASIGVQNVSETSTPTYSVTIAIDAGDDDVRIGATARATVTLSTAHDVLTVPSSAVTLSGSQASVVLLKDGTPQQTSVEVGATGTERIEITKGISAGQTVVLADLDEQIASTSDTTSSNGLTGLSGSRSSRGGFTGGGFTGGGFSGGQGAPPAG
ncbi:biotin/lipoyl-binding protein [Microbacterium protaetiae]|nr:biotin/lipoyl-binding protein [Microbacterium protaetiae]